MGRKEVSLEKRIKNIQGIYDTLDNLCSNIPETYGKQIKKLILGDKNLEELIHSLNKYRAPRILLVGRTGFGKSSIINALIGKYEAEVCDVESCTTGTLKHTYNSKAGVPIDIMDTRGIDESISLDKATSAEQQITEDVIAFEPDVVLLVLSCTSRDGMNRDFEFIKALRMSYYQKNAVELPVVIAVNKADAVAPARETLPYSSEKQKNINLVEQQIRHILFEEEMKVSGIIPVSSCIDWMDEYGNELKTANQLNALTEEEKQNLTISFDGRYRIQDLMDLLEKSIEDAEANMGIKLAFRLDLILEKIAKKFVEIFIGISALCVGVSLPIADYGVLVALESVLVALIMSLSGRDLSLDSAKDFIGSICGTAAAGVALRGVAHIAVKFIPVAGGFISAGIAGAGVKMIGDAAIEYYIKGKDFKTVQKEFQRNSKVQKAKDYGKKTANKIGDFTKKIVRKK